jgi:hypothetical protein
MGSPDWFEFSWHGNGIGVGWLMAFWPYTCGDDKRGHYERMICVLTLHLLICTLDFNIPLWRIK